MSRRKRPQPEHGSPHEQHLRDIVDELVQEESQKAAYLAFAHELAAAERSSSFVHRSSSVIPREQGDSRNLAAMETRRDPSIGVGVTKGRDPSIPLGMTKGRDPSTSGAQRTVGTSGVTGAAERASYIVRRSSFQVPDYSVRTKRVVMKWFGRGLSGHLMWLIGKEVLGTPG